MQTGCVLLLKNTKTGREPYGCAGTRHWLIDKELSTVDEVETLDEAVKRPILDETFAVVWASAIIKIRPNLTYTILRRHGD